MRAALYDNLLLILGVSRHRLSGVDLNRIFQVRIGDVDELSLPPGFWMLVSHSRKSHSTWVGHYALHLT